MEIVSFEKFYWLKYKGDTDLLDAISLKLNGRDKVHFQIQNKEIPSTKLELVYNIFH